VSTASTVGRAGPTLPESDTSAAVAPSGPSAPSGPAFTDLSYRAWFWCFVAVFAGVAALVVGRVIPGQYANLAGYFLYMALACTFFPLNTLWIVLWLATQFPASLVALVGAVGTSLANLNDYYFLSYLFEFDRVKRLRERRGYQRAVAWFDRAPFLSLTTFSFLPIPVDVVRLLAISRRYSRLRFTAASFLGRFPRYYLLARGWQWLGLPNQWLFLVVAGVAGLFLLRHVRWGRLWGRAQAAKEPAPAAVAETEVPRE
jgi:membrane protein YqaA with SNARE-associated domain